MKKNHYLLLIFSLFIISCSSDDDSSASSGVNNAIPLSIGNYWVYDVTMEGITGRDSLYISNDTTINGNIYKKFKTKSFPFGFYSTSLRGNGLRNTDGKLYLSGGVDTGIPDFPLDLTISDFIIFDTNATAGTQLTSVNGSTQQQLEGFNIDITYTLSSEAGESYSSFTTPNNEVYNNVKESVVKLNMQVKVSIPDFPFPYTILPAQDVVVSTQYYAENIGMIHTSTNTQYALSSLPTIELPIPQSYSEHQEETLSSYNVE
ncbi:hypothetical protein FUA48_13900 [Flavobacterium alkalisoli]|uniref:Lipoprotein n=1 Tax=Flavobacterium alkalisoli TaxID=2602769 RepID=A0A5B9FUL4_9FLAO|nr:hypothetical protein [Flavobacterium alkalisoli]QEE50630.1 hypothetical protein FUA48_13900 [Flavobacterium alkalisoli]